jgi:hypothetical protein
MICVYVVGSFTIRTPAKTQSLFALTMIDPVTAWLEIVKATSKSTTSIHDLFHNTWLARYPKSKFIVFDNQSIDKFKREFKQVCVNDNYAIKAKSITSHNQQTESKCNP